MVTIKFNAYIMYIVGSQKHSITYVILKDKRISAMLRSFFSNLRLISSNKIVKDKSKLLTC